MKTDDQSQSPWFCPFQQQNWTIAELIKLMSEMRKLVTFHRMQHPKADVDRLYFPYQKEVEG